jgi:hypothetical protein
MATGTDYDPVTMKPTMSPEQSDRQRRDEIEELTRYSEGELENNLDNMSLSALRLLLIDIIRARDSHNTAVALASSLEAKVRDHMHTSASIDDGSAAVPMPGRRIG